LGYSQSEVLFRGFAIEVRVNAEDPAYNFRPAPGTIDAYREPGGLGVRVDSAAYAGWTIPPDYDSLIAKLVVWSPSREMALARMRRAIDEYAVEGVPTTLPFLRALADQPAVLDATYGTATLERFAQTYSPAARNGAHVPQPTTQPQKRRLAPRLRAMHARENASSGDDVRSPMHGIVVEVLAREGQTVEENEVVAIVEAMKMMNEVRAHKNGVVASIDVAPGATVESGTPLLHLQAHPSTSSA
jgi:acetyl-CoA/propionyl-CoA carboxylase biotin carboxyl carrier protein